MPNALFEVSKSCLVIIVYDEREKSKTASGSTRVFVCKNNLVGLNAVQAFLNFHCFNFLDFQFSAVYDSILFFSPLVTLIYAVFASAVFLLCPHINSVNRGMPVQIFQPQIMQFLLKVR